jgi:hypothetical protein
MGRWNPLLFGSLNFLCSNATKGTATDKPVQMIRVGISRTAKNEVEILPLAINAREAFCRCQSFFVTDSTPCEDACIWRSSASTGMQKDDDDFPAEALVRWVYQLHDQAGLYYRCEAERLASSSQVDNVSSRTYSSCPLEVIRIRTKPTTGAVVLFLYPSASAHRQRWKRYTAEQGVYIFCFVSS